MKEQTTLGLQSVISLFVLGFFIWLGIGSIGSGTQQSRHLGNGVYETAKHYGNGKTEIITGRQDGHGNYHGEVTITIEKDGDFVQKEQVTMINGVRHGESYTILQGNWYKKCYDHGVRIECEKSAKIQSEKNIVSEDIIAYELFYGSCPWMVLKLIALGLDSGYIESYVDTIETLLYSHEFQEDEFDGVYEDIFDELDDTRFDSITAIYAEVYLFYGLDLIKNTELRMATIDRYRSEDNSTYNMVFFRYPHYLETLNSYNVSDEDFEAFCGVYDSLLTSYGPLENEDPYFLDSLDNRMFRALEYISSDEKSASFELSAFKNELITGLKLSSNSFKKKILVGLKKAFIDSDSLTVSEVVLGLIFLKFNEADLIKESVKTAWYLNKGFILPPTVTTSFTDILSGSSVSLKGNVIEDGGGNITDRGIAWAKYYNPTTSDHVVNSGTGTGVFTETISELEEGKTYYARAFASNSAGTSYGNSIAFNTSTSTGVYEAELATAFDVFPNPATNLVNLYFNLDSPGGWMLTVINLQGQIIYSNNNLNRGENTVVLNLEKYENGTYICILRNHENQFAQKFIVLH